MPRLLPAVIAFAGLLLALGCSRDATPPDGGTPPAVTPVGSDPAERATLVAGNTAFAFALLPRVGADQADQNLAVSPFSVSSAFAAPYRGAAGSTAQEIQEVLRYGLPPDKVLAGFRSLREELAAKAKPGGTLTVAEAVWMRKGGRVRPEFRTAIEQAAGEVRELAAGDPTPGVNEWVAKATNGTFRDLLARGDVPPDTTLLVTSALHLKAGWENPFDRDWTVAERFRGPGVARDVAMMNLTAPLRAVETPAATVVELPLLGGEFVVDVILPASSTALAAFEAKVFTSTAYAGWLEQLKSKTVRLGLPRFTIDTRLDLANALSLLGMPGPFAPVADFSALSEDRVFLSRAFQRAQVTLDEVGVTATAATAMTIKPRTAPPKPDLTVSFDRPFVFVIRAAASRTVLFVGHVVRPDPFR